MTDSESFEAPDGQSAPEQLDEWLSLARGDELPDTDRRPVHETVAAVATARPAEIAVRCAGTEIRYCDLDARTRSLAERLMTAGVAVGDRVAILVEPSIDMVVAALAIMRTGAAYVPIDPAQPGPRIAAILADASVAIAVVDDRNVDRLAGLPVATVSAAYQAKCLMWNETAVTAEHPAYVVYTSGSTGEPKGVLVEHGQLAASTLARRQVYPGWSAFLLVSPLAFDSSVAGLWGTLTSGGRLVVATTEEVRDTERLVALIDEHGITRVLCIPSLYRVILDTARRLGPHRLASLETVIVAGEPLPESLVEQHFALLPQHVALVNEYGPTEATVWASQHRFTGPGPVSIGRPIPGASLYVLDEDLRPVPRGVAGELFIGGDGVARGYVGRPEATARSFLPDRFAGTPGARMYRTGDIVRCNGAGTLNFLGRRDDQVKIRGHRIELGAVETALRGVAGVADAVVMPSSDRMRLVGFVVAAADTRPMSIRRQASMQLAPAMVPAEIHVLDSLPRNTNGKVDRAALRRDIDRTEPAPTSGAPVNGSAAAPVGDQVTAQVVAAWAEVLDLAEVPVDVNFIDLGGNSLAVFRLQDALDRHTGTRPPMVALFDSPTVAAQSDLIRATRENGGAKGDQDARPASARGRVARARQQRLQQETAI